MDQQQQSADANHEGLRLEWEGCVLSATLDWPAARNSLNRASLAALHRAVDRAEENDACRLIAFRGTGGVFCTGLDFTQSDVAPADEWDDEKLGYGALLRRLTETPRVVFALVDGTVLAGGVGIAAACDVVVATPHSSFRLTEAMWGLLPANVAPYLIRRTGFQPAYRMALTTMPVSTQEAERIGLVDLSTDDLDAALRRAMLLIRRVSGDTVAQMKTLFRTLWIMDPESQAFANSEMQRCLSSDSVRENFRRFRASGRFPWEDS